MSNMIPKCFVINMPASQQRREMMEPQLQKLGFDYEFFAATDGRHLSEKEMQKCQPDDRVTLNLRGGFKVFLEGKVTAKEIGCALSHLRLYQHIVDLGLDRALVFEDDLHIHPDMVMALENLDCITEPWDVVNFSFHMGVHDLPWARKYYFGPSKDYYFKQIGMQNVYLDIWRNRCRMVGCTAMYVITKHACERLLEIGYPVRMPSDYLLGLLCYNELRMFRAYPIKHYTSFSAAESTIDDRLSHRLVRR
ncbi:MAG TPA: glycosyltransferase family 25 protein [Candidatus Anaerobiospirillum pullistercoris]|uniref:Glycosyltransferase family 25 protein n=1 Tax=Candidatus Anaerobiospirillum pullistercoris TaxID=2838452 RepID=A0A9D1WEA5_9GAMM|nr:glycosyltransferase family 25 protein [Candidatus Anaerobiospirillum pullistercoris]